MSLASFDGPFNVSALSSPLKQPLSDTGKREMLGSCDHTGLNRYVCRFFFIQAMQDR